MASLFKPTYTKMNPATGRKETRKSRKWYVKYRDADDIVRRVPGYTDKEATRQLAAKLERSAEMTRVGITDPFEAHRKRPLAEHLGDFVHHLRDKGVGEDQVKLVSSRTRKVVAGCKFVFITDLSASRVEAFLADLRRGGASLQTSNFYLQAIKQFARWLVRDRRTGDNPLAHLTALNVKTDRRHDRRSLTTEEFASLLEAAETGAAHHRLTGPDRAMLYILAAWTGYRAGELASLSLRSFDLASEPATIKVKAGYSKRRREDTIPLRADLAARLGHWLSDKGTINPVAPLFPSNMRTAEMIRVDLERAGIPYRDAEGHFADFHALRHTFISNLAQSGVHPKMAQTLARHSTITLTMDRYAHVGLSDQVAAVNCLPPIPGGSCDQPEGPWQPIQRGRRT